MRNENNIIIDIDDTVANLKDPLMDLLNFESGKNINHSDWNVYNVFTEIYELDVNYIFKKMIETKIIENLKPVENSIEYVNKSYVNNNIIFLTARGWHPSAYDVTYKWLADSGFHFDKLIICENNYKKINIVEKIKNVTLFIDDKYSNYRDVQCAGFCAKLKTQPWNLLLECNEGDRFDNFKELN